jgi:hypothetical protein
LAPFKRPLQQSRRGTAEHPPKNVFEKAALHLRRVVADGLRTVLPKDL